MGKSVKEEKLSPLCIRGGKVRIVRGWNNDENFTITISAYHRLLMMRRKVEAELLLLLITLLNVGIFSAEVFDSPVFKKTRPCVGSIKTYQVTGTNPRNFTITGSRRRLRIRLPESVTLTAEGNCCWEVFRRPHYKSTSTIVTSSHGDLVMTHRVRSVRQVPCHQLASVSWISASVGLVLVITVTVVTLGYRRVMRNRNNNNNNNINNNSNNNNNQEAVVKYTPQICVISESYA